MRKIHYISGSIISLFIILHLVNHLFALESDLKHIEIMNFIRPIYRNLISESFLILAIIIQIFSGIKFFFALKKSMYLFDKIQRYSGLYLALFFLIHLSAIGVCRWVLKLDSNFYFGAAGINTFPYLLFFIPYYFLAIFSFFGHIASIHYKKMKKNIFHLNPHKQAVIILIIGFFISFLCIYGLSNHFKGYEIPEVYQLNK